MVRLFVSSAIDCVFEPRSGQTKDYKTGICCFSVKHVTLRGESENSLTEIMTICPKYLSGETCLPSNCCFR